MLNFQFSMENDETLRTVEQGTVEQQIGGVLLGMTAICEILTSAPSAINNRLEES